MSWNRKPRVLVVGDSSTIHTGFARVVKEICMHLYDLDKYDLKTIGWFHKQTDEIVPYEIIPTNMENPQVFEEDKYSLHTFPKVVKEFKPDLVLAIGDSWMTEHIAMSPLRPRFKLILYIPIDGMPIPYKWTEAMAKCDAAVAYGAFGKMVISQRAPQLKNLVSINHGVDLDTFKPIDDEEVQNIRKAFGKNDFMMGCVARNQPRKALPRLFKAFRLFINPYTVCNECGEVWLHDIPECQICKSKNLFKGKGKDDAKLYLHMALQDCGWDIYDMIDRFDLTGKVAYPKGLQVGMGVPTERLVKIMNALDAFVLPTTGEGWGLPILEAMACGLPVVVTNYSAHTEFCKDVCQMINVSEFVSEPMTNIERAYVDVYDFAMRMDLLYYDDKELFLRKWKRHIETSCPDIDVENLLTGKELRLQMSKASRERAMDYSWKRVNEEWVSLMDGMLEYDALSEVEKEETFKVEEL